MIRAWRLEPPSSSSSILSTASLFLGFCFSVPSNALALSGSPYEFEGDRAGDAFWVMRLIGYPGACSTNGSDIPINDVLSSWFPRCSRFVHFWRPNNSRGADTDDGLLTLVNQDDDITALQVRNLSGEWISAPPVLGTFVCNIGDMLKIYSNGLYESTLHQVINSSPKYRVCVAYLYETNFDTAVEPWTFVERRQAELRNSKELFIANIWLRKH